MREDGHRVGTDNSDAYQTGYSSRHTGLLAARQDTSQLLPRSDDHNETTLTTLDVDTQARPARGGNGTRPTAEHNQLTLPTLSAPTSSDDLWSNVPPGNHSDTSSLRSDNTLQHAISFHDTR